MLIAILGRQPKIGLAELQSVIGSNKVEEISKNTALLDSEPINFARFGSVIKFAEVLKEQAAINVPVLQKILIQTALSELDNASEGKFKLGLSFYGESTPSSTQINSMGLSIKKAIKNKGFSVRVVPNKQTYLTSAQVIHNSLTSAKGLELILVSSDGRLYIAKTLYEQDIEAYAARDQARPKRDARIGMLPPKLAQTIINLASGQSGFSSARHHTPAPALLDPFCGTGVILQEALLMGFTVYGTDLDTRMVEYSKQNIEWLNKKFKINNLTEISSGDATSYVWKNMPKVVATEAYLGRPLSSPPKPEVLSQIIQDVNTLLKKALLNISKQLPKDGRLCIAVPAWRTGKNSFKTLPILDQIDKIGYNQLEFNNINPSDLIYARDDQIVGRQLVTLTKA